jgi:hypothetical protein
MTRRDEPSDQEVCCLPGDITVTQIPTGYLIGRALEQIGPGPWWEYVRIVETFEDASGLACEMAKHDQVRAWLHRGGDEYDRLDGGPNRSAPDVRGQEAF